MTRDIVRIHIERLIVHGADSSRLDPTDLHAMTEGAIARELDSIDLPAGRRITASSIVKAEALSSDTATVAQWIARGVAQGVRAGRADE